MELAHAQEILGRLYHQVSGPAISLAEQKRMGREEDSTTYGEVRAASVHELLSAVAPREGENFIDLGSGLGTATLAAAMLFPFRRLVGVELLTGLGDAARKALSRYDAEVRPQLSELHQQQRIEFLDGDLLEVDLSDFDVVFSQAVCFDAELMAKMAARLETLKSGARVVLVGHQLSSSAFTQIDIKVMRANWGTSLTWVYQRD
jgi:trans-aconitate methyltransferase